MVMHSDRRGGWAAKGRESVWLSNQGDSTRNPQTLRAGVVRLWFQSVELRIAAWKWTAR